MTIAIAIPCSDGIVLASDSMGHAERVATRVPKVQVVDQHLVSIATSGSEFMTQAALTAIRKHPPGPGVSPIVLARTVSEAMRHAHDQPIAPSDGSESSHQIELLISSWTNPGSPSLVHLPADLAAIECVDRQFVAIGSAADFAHVVFTTLSHLVETRPAVAQGKTLAFRIISTVCQVSSWGVAPPIQMSSVTSDGAQIVSDTELEQINADVTGWLAVESSHLVPEEAQAPPLPDPSDGAVDDWPDGHYAG